MELWDLIAREQIRDTLARYSWSGDAMRLDELVLAFCEDGLLELRGREPIVGREAIAAMLGGVADRADAAVRTVGGERIVRHNLANTRFLELEPDRALVASYFTVVTEIGLDHVGRYRDELVPVGDEWLIRHRFVSTDWVAEGSNMAARGRG